MTATDDSKRLHFLEAIASGRVRAVVNDDASAVWAELSRPGMGGVDNCLAAVGLWAPRFLAKGVRCEQLGRQLTIGIAEEGGYRLPTGKVVDHHFLAVGEELALFDPTAGSTHIGHLTDMPLDRYLVADGTPFPEWRRRWLEGK